MRQRDMILLAVIGTVVVIGGYWMLLLTPKLNELSKLDKQVAAKQQELDKARSQAQSGQDAKLNFTTTYARMAEIGKAAPPAGSVDDDIPSLILQLNHAGIVSSTSLGAIDVQATGAGGSSGGSTSSGGSPSSGASGDASQSAGGTSSAPSSPSDSTGASGSSSAASTLTPAPFEFTYKGDFFRLEDLVSYLNGMVHAHGQQLKIKGRLVNIKAIDFTVSANGGSSLNPAINAVITVDAYNFPGETSVAAGTSAAGSSTATPAPQGGTAGSAATSTPEVPPTATVRRP